MKQNILLKKHKNKLPKYILEKSKTGWSHQNNELVR